MHRERDEDRVGAWVPPLAGAERERALASARDLAAELAHDTDDVQDGSLASGAAGIALFLHEADEAGVYPGGRALAARMLVQAVAGSRAGRAGPELYLGLLGPAWVVAATQPAHAVDMVAARLDPALLDLVEALPETAHYDLITGLVGIGVYALERLPARSGEVLATAVVRRLSERAREQPAGIAWAARSAGEGDPRGEHFNLGIAHGTPGVIGLLASLQSAGCASGAARELLEPAVTWLLAQRDGEGRLPYFVEPGIVAEPARLAWCYGDPGAALVLLRAARSLGRSDWELAAVEQALAAAHLPDERSGIVDTGLCHGAFGTAHAFARLHAMTGVARLAGAARRWLGWALDRGRLAPNPGFLTGAAGAGLALLAAASSAEPRWDRVMLLSGT